GPGRGDAKAEGPPLAENGPSHVAAVKRLRCAQATGQRRHSGRCVMGKVRIRRTGNGSGFTKTPNATGRDRALSWAARGYLAEMLSNRDDWEPETLPQAAARAR